MHKGKIVLKYLVLLTLKNENRNNEFFSIILQRLKWVEKYALKCIKNSQILLKESA